jgi:hypothetical protein
LFLPNWVSQHILFTVITTLVSSLPEPELQFQFNTLMMLLAKRLSTSGGVVLIAIPRSRLHGVAPLSILERSSVINVVYMNAPTCGHVPSVLMNSGQVERRVNLARKRSKNLLP